MNIYLCSGLGGIGLSDNWVRIDIDPQTKPTIIADVRKLPLRPKLKPQKLFMSPPCTYFTWARPFPRKGVGLAFEILGACFEAVNYLMPETWVLENPRNHLEKIIGRPSYRERWKAADMVSTHNLWGSRKTLRRSKIPHRVVTA